MKKLRAAVAGRRSFVMDEPPPDTIINEPEKLSDKLGDNLDALKVSFCLPDNNDIVLREFLIGGVPACIVFLDGMASGGLINLNIMEPLLKTQVLDGCPPSLRASKLLTEALTINEAKLVASYGDAKNAILEGRSLLLLHGCADGIVMETRGYEKRSVERPMVESVVFGPQEAFNENLRTNISLIRRIIRRGDLVTEIINIGADGNTPCALMYIKSAANPSLVDEARKRLNSVKAPYVSGSGYVQQQIEDHPNALFPQMVTTERPDRASSFLSEGQIVILSDGAPFALGAPCTFFHLIHASDDTFMRWYSGTFVRMIRYIGLFFAALLPSIYLSIILYHQELLPMALLSSIAATRATLPFPMVMEVLIIELSFDLIHEAGTRVPGQVSGALGIIGALILGQAAVAADIISPMIIIVVSLTGLGSFVIPDYSLGMSIRIMRFLFIIFAAVAGLPGVAMGVFLVLTLLCSMNSFGVPYMAPLAPRMPSNPDMFVRWPLNSQKGPPRFFWPRGRRAR